MKVRELMEVLSKLSPELELPLTLKLSLAEYPPHGGEGGWTKWHEDHPYSLGWNGGGMVLRKEDVQET